MNPSLPALPAVPVPSWLYALRLLPASLRGKGRIARRLMNFAALEGPVKIEAGGVTFWAPSAREPVAFHLIVDGLYDADTCAVLKQALRPGSVFMDVGANIGAMSITAARRWCPQGRVIAFEASPGIHRYLAHNAAQNAIAGLTILHRAVSNASGLTLPFYEAPDAKFGMGSLADRFGGQETGVPTLTLDDAMQQLAIERVDVIKVDVEGFELEVFQGSQRLLQQDPSPLIVFEFNDWAEARDGAAKAGDAQRFLRSLGYTTLAIKPFLQGDHAEQPVMTSGGCDFVAFRHPHSR